MANALEMAASAMIQKMLANLPPELTANIGQIGQVVAGVQAQLNRIENQQRLIMSHLNIPADTPQPPKELRNGQRE